jgi:putative transposase
MQYMYTNNSNKLCYRDRLSVVKQHNSGRSVSRVAKFFSVSRQTIYNIIERFKIDSVYGLEDRRPGPLKKPLNPSFYAHVVELRQRTGWGSCRIEKYFNAKGFFVTHNKINEVIQYEGLTRKKMGKQSKPKYVSYEADNINDQWHIDWSKDPLSKKELLAIIDDKSRFIVFAGLFESASAENSALGLKMAIKRYGAPKEIVSDNGSHFKNVHSKRTSSEPLKVVEKEYNIKHIFIRAHYPQSNGKIERWFGSYKGEFPMMNHPKVKDCMSWVRFYNFERIHQSLNYETPAHVYLGVKSI